MISMKEELRYILEDSGEQCVMTHGTIVMLKLFVDNLDLELYKPV